MKNADVLGLLAAIADIDAADSTADVLKIFRVALETYGLTSFLIAGLPVPNDREWQKAILVDGWPPDWFARYGAEGHFLHDPCAARCRHSAEPFLWSELPEATLTSRAQLVMNEAASFGLKNGLCIPVHVPLSGPGVVTASSDRIEISHSALPLIETICVHAFRKLGNTGTSGADGDDLPLTPRERELLQWSAQGKTTEDISCILGVTANTVESHQRNIRVKLDAINVAHAIVKALRRHEIQI